MHSTAKKKKILIVTTSLANGGAERSTALLTKLLSQLGYEIHLVAMVDKVEFQFEGTLFNLGKLKEEKDTFLGRINRFLVYRKYIKQNNFDWIIDNRTRFRTIIEIIISKFFYPKTANVICMVRSFNISWYFPKNEFIAKRLYTSAKYIIGVSKDIKAEVEKTYHYTNVKTIYNPIDFENIVELSNEYQVNGNFILAYGRIEDDIKNYSLLIDAYISSELPKRNILLYIMGEGKDLANLQHKVNRGKFADSIQFIDKQVNPFPYVKAALFTVLTSKFEGFPRAIIESLAIGIPVVSVNCKSGPEEIIINEVNGLLIENNNVELLAEAMNRMIVDDNLYQKCKANAQNSIQHLSLDNISKQWEELLK